MMIEEQLEQSKEEKYRKSIELPSFYGNLILSLLFFNKRK
jgi:hypothetical protein